MTEAIAAAKVAGVNREELLMTLQTLLGFFHPVAVIVIDLVLILLGGLAQYGILIALYHVPLSKIAFGAAMRKSQG